VADNSSKVDTSLVTNIDKRLTYDFYHDQDIQDNLKTFLMEKINDLTVLYGIQYNPFVNGKYMIFMIDGPWFSTITKYTGEGKDLISNIDFFKNYNTNINKNKVYNYLATDIDIPEPTKEYINISSRSQTISHYQREVIMPDFNISYIENNDMYVIRYHELWHKTIELYRRGKIDLKLNEINSEKSKYFYEVPYVNGIFILVFDLAYQVRGLIYLVGVKPVSMPLKQVIGNRSGSKMTVYNIQYKLSNMYYKFFKNTKDFDDYLKQSDKYVLAKLFKKNLLNNSTSTFQD